MNTDITDSKSCCHALARTQASKPSPQQLLEQFSSELRSGDVNR
jgi:hypothetical protein